MVPREHSDRIHGAFNDHRLVATAGVLPATLALLLVWANWRTNTLTCEMSPATSR